MPEVRLVAEAADAGAGPGAQGDAPLDGGAHEPGQDGRGLGKWVGGRLVVFRLELAAGEQLSDPGAGGGEDVRHVVVARWGVNYSLAQRLWSVVSSRAPCGGRDTIDLQAGV
jgi:hypothetical protein